MLVSRLPFSSAWPTSSPLTQEPLQNLLRQPSINDTFHSVSNTKVQTSQLAPSLLFTGNEKHTQRQLITDLTNLNHDKPVKACDTSSINKDAYQILKETAKQKKLSVLRYKDKIVVYDKTRISDLLEVMNAPHPQTKQKITNPRLFFEVQIDKKGSSLKNVMHELNNPRSMARAEANWQARQGEFSPNVPKNIPKDLDTVGPNKALGYISEKEIAYHFKAKSPSEKEQAIQKTIDYLEAEHGTFNLRRRNSSGTDDKCPVVYTAYFPRVKEILDEQESQKILIKAKWPTGPEAVVRKISLEWVEKKKNPDLFNLIARLFKYEEPRPWIPADYRNDHDGYYTHIASGTRAQLSGGVNPDGSAQFYSY